MPAGSKAQPRMSKVEVVQLYSAAGFSVVDDRPANRCGKAAKPRVTFVDINGDKQPEALFVDANAECYAPSDRYFAVLTKEGSSWRALITGTGSIQALASNTSGWMDMRVSDAGCTRDYRFSGRSYQAVTSCPGTPPAATVARPAEPASPSATGKPASMKLTAGEEEAALRAAGFKKRGGTWRNCDDSASPMPSSGGVSEVTDLNGDGLPEAVLGEGGSFCYGNTGQAFWLVSKTASGQWKLMTNAVGIPQFLKTKGQDGWPDISIGGPGFCFPVRRWNGREYRDQRWEYDGKPCKPPR
jgi:hypothetical protein